MICDTDTFLTSIEKKRLLGIDYGAKHIGLALSDLSQTIASAHKTLRFTTNAALLNDLQTIASEFEITGIVIGMPRNMNGTYGPLAEAAEKLAQKLAPLNLPILLWDERLSTAVAHRTLSGVMTQKRKKKVIDQIAATLILQNFLDYLKTTHKEFV